MSYLKALMDSIPLPEGEPFLGETLRADGWVYHDLPRMTPECLILLIGYIGKDEYRWLSFAKYDDGSVRGQMFVSPQGMENIRASRRASA